MINPEKLNFKHLIMTIGNLPSSYVESLSYYECLLWLCNYLENTVIPAVNNNASALEELQGLFTQLQNYVANYFDNLNVQEEINTKLDEMAENGSLTILIKNYIDPIQAEFENTVNSNLGSMQSQINSLSSGSPKGVYATVEALTTADPEHNYIYVVTADGKWYYYDTSETKWVAGGTYQATVESLDTTLTIKDGIPDSKCVGDKVNNIVKTENVFDKNGYTDNAYINGSGVVTTSENYFLTNIIKLKAGDTVYPQYWKTYSDQTIRPYVMFRISIVQADGTWISNSASTGVQKWTAESDCYIRITFNKETVSVESSSDINNYVTISINTPLNKYLSYNYELINNDKGLDDISEYINQFNPDDFSYSSSINAQGYLTHAPNYFTTNLIKVESGDILYLKYFNNDDSIQFYNVIKYDTSMHFTARSTVNAKTFTSNFNGYVKFTCTNTNLKEDIGDYLVISKNQEVTEYVPYKRYLITKSEINNVAIDKIDNDNYLITYGDFKVTLFKTDNNDTNSHNWNLKNVTDKVGNTIVPVGTDILGPIKVNNNTDFIGGVHGDETTDNITVAINNASYDLDDVTQLSGKSLNLIIKSSVYDESTKDKVADRFMNIRFVANKITVSNSYKFVANVTLNVATNGGLIACRNNIIKDLIFNNQYYAEAPTTSQSIASKYNTSATINTIYGSVTVNNIKGYLNDHYVGYLQVFTNESPKRCKIYFMTYAQGTYSITSGDIITGEFEYLFS